jgi:N-acetylglucosaminyl-diphospho-decaprenol L-rhamnosyltransferase
VEAVAKQRAQRAQLLIVILNYRTAELTMKCLRSVARELSSFAGAEVVVTDNDSGDGSAERIARFISANDMGAWARCEPLPKNGGYAYGNNAPVRRALLRPDPPEFVLLLNPDTELQPGAIDALVDFMRDHPECSIAGSRLLDEQGRAHASAFNFPSAWSELDRGVELNVITRLLADRSVHLPIPDQATEVDWVAGASMLVRREVFEAIGLIDEGYFLYFEEVDFLLRAKRAGFRTFYVPTSRVIHHMGASTGVTDEKQPPRRLPSYWFDSRRRYFLKNHGMAHALLADSAFLTGRALRKLRLLVAPKATRPDPPHMVGDYLKHNVLVRGAKLAAVPSSPNSLVAPEPPLQGPRTLRELMQYWAEDYEVHRRDASRPGFRAVAVHRFGNYRMHVRKPWRGLLTLIYQPLYEHCRNHYGVELPYSAKVGRRVLFEHQGGIVIHGCAEIGDECIIRQGVTLGNRHMNAPFAAPVLGVRVNVGAGAKILGDIQIGNEASIGANSVVLEDVPAGSVAVGIPARILPGR